VGGCLMRLSSSPGVFESVWLSGSEHGVQDVDAPAGEGDDGLVVAFAFGALAGVEGAAGGVVERAEGRLVEDALEGLVSNRPGGCGGGDIYATRFHHRQGWLPPGNLGCTINSAAEEAGPVRIRHELYFSSTRTGNSDIYASPAFGPWIGPPTPVAELNSPFEDARPFVRSDGREIVFDSNRPGGVGVFDVWTATRRHRWTPWSQPVNLGPAVNSAAAETRPLLSSEGTILYFGSTRGASQDVFTSTRTR
jgi:WD40-like Beta Propeller Repeat